MYNIYIYVFYDLSLQGTALTQVNFLHGTTGDSVRTLILKENEINSFIPGSFLGIVSPIQI